MTPFGLCGVGVWLLWGDFGPHRLFPITIFLIPYVPLGKWGPWGREWLRGACVYFETAEELYSTITQLFQKYTHAHTPLDVDAHSVACRKGHQKRHLLFCYTIKDNRPAFETQTTPPMNEFWSGIDFIVDRILKPWWGTIPGKQSPVRAQHQLTETDTQKGGGCVQAWVHVALWLRVRTLLKKICPPGCSEPAAFLALDPPLPIDEFYLFQAFNGSRAKRAKPKAALEAPWRRSIALATTSNWLFLCIFAV